MSLQLCSNQGDLGSCISLLDTRPELRMTWLMMSWWAPAVLVKIPSRDLLVELRNNDRIHLLTGEDPLFERWRLDSELETYELIYNGF
jgi:hypothetical protein